jgi:hypothetical protein
VITGGVYAGQKVVDEKIEDTPEFGDLEYK